MKRKPWALVIISFFHLLAPLGNFIFNALKSGRTFESQWFHWFQVLPKYLVFSYVGLPVLAGVFIFLCRQWSYWAYVICIALIALSNVFSFLTYMSVTAFIAVAALLIIDLVVVGYFVVPSVQKVYFDPRLRWWEAAPRYKFDQDGDVNGTKVFINNLAQGGLYLTTSTNLNEGDLVDVSWTFEGQTAQQLKGRVVYKNTNSEPLGYGIRFEALSRENQKKVLQAVQSLSRQGKIVATRLPGPEDSFGLWLKRLFKTGEGLFPKIRS